MSIALDALKIAPRSAQGVFLAINTVSPSVNLHYRIAGAGAPIVLTSGLGDTSEVWTGLWDQLHQQARALIWDLRGHGQSCADPLADYRPSLALSDLGEMLAEAGGSSDNPAVLIGPLTRRLSLPAVGD